jgi:uncharacterized protein
MRILFTITTLLIAMLTFAQQKQHKIVFDFSKGDTASFSTMIRQMNNIMNAASNAQLEVVCHGPGLGLILKDKSPVQAEIQELQKKYNVVFAACESSMKRMGIDKSQLISQAIAVPLASLEISSKQQDGWSYIKAGQ